MQTRACTNCGAVADSPMKFCRQCGQPLDGSEMTTRQLEEPKPYAAMPRYDAPTQLTNAGPTSPAYMPPDAMPPQWVQPTAGIPSGGQKKALIILASVIGVLLLTLAALLFVMMNKSAPTRFGPTIPPSPPIAPSGPSEASPPAPPGTSGSVPTTMAKDLIYPGATVTMSVPGDRGKGVVNLTAHDSFDKVVDWYLARIKSPKRVMLPGPTATLTGDGIAVVITGAGDETNIIIAQGEEQ